MISDVIIEDEALEQLIAIRDYIAGQATPKIAQSFTDKVLDYAQSLDIFPHRGADRSDIRPGIRTISFRKRAVIVFTVNDTTKTVSILGIYYGGQDWESLLSEPDESVT